MKQVKLLQYYVIIFSLIFLSGCVPVLVGGMFYSSNESKKACAKLLSDEKLSEKLEIPEYREYYQKVCKPKSKEDFESAKKPEGLLY